MVITYNRRKNELTVKNKLCTKKIKASCLVRNELNGWRRKHIKSEVVRALSKHNTLTDSPVMPRQFPKGKWKVTTVEKRHDEYRAPYIILTDAWQYLDVWSLDGQGGYKKNTDKKVADFQYGIHYSTSNTTTGCIKIEQKDAMIKLAELVLKQRLKGKEVYVNVI